MSEGKQERVIPVKHRRELKCHECGNDNLLHGLKLAKASTQMMIGGPGQMPQFIGSEWAVYLCISCENFFPYPKSYSVERKLQQTYRQILDWCEGQAELKKSRKSHLEKLASIIESNKDLLGLPGQKEDSTERTLEPLLDRIDSLEKEVRSKKGGRPKHCKSINCKIKAQYDGFCKAHFMEINNG